MLGSQKWKKLLELPPGSAASGDDRQLAAASSTQHVAKIAEAGLHVQHSTIDIHLGEWSTIDWPSLAVASGAHVQWIVG